MMLPLRNIGTDTRGAAAIQFAIALPAFLMMVWGMLQMGLVFQANAGMQHALGEAARYATIYPTPTDSQIQSLITSSKFGVGNGTWSTPSIATDTGAGTKTITVTYSQPMNFLFFNGPNVSITKSKVIHVSS